MDLDAARGDKGSEARKAERERFDQALASMMMMDGRRSDRSSPPPPPRLVVTDSQAIDVVHEWTLLGTEGQEGEEEGGGGGSGGGSGGSGGGSGGSGGGGGSGSNKRAAGKGSSTRSHHRGAPLVDITTFSIAMAARQSGGAEQLALLVEGIAAARRLKEVRVFYFCLFFHCFRRQRTKKEKKKSPSPTSILTNFDPPHPDPN